LIVGLIFIPVTGKIFSRFFDKGYLFSKIIGLALLTFTLWLLSSFHILPFYAVCVYALLIAAILVIYIGLKGYKEFKALFTDFANQKVFIYEEALFLLCLVFFAFVKGHNPSAGVEMPMDFAFLNDLLHTKFMPPVDMWFAGVPANYYYYGHYVFAFLTKLSNIDSAITYNLAMITLFAFCFTLTFSLTANLVYLIGKQKMRSVIIAGLISASLLSLGGNLHTIIYADILPAAKSIGLYHDAVGSVDKDYFYADPRSYIGNNPATDDRTITEFPSYSLILGDLHAQIIDVIFVLTFIALLFAFLISSLDRIKGRERQSKKEQSKWYKITVENILMVLLLPVLWMTNAWDFPIYVTVAGAVFLYVNLKKYDFRLESLVFTLIDGFRVLILSLLLLVPFFINFFNPTEGVKFTHFLHIFSPLYAFQFFVVWGYQIFFVILFMVYIFYTQPKDAVQASLRAENGRKLRKQTFAKKEDFFSRTKRFLSELSGPDIFVLILSLCALGLVMLSELIFQKDVSGADNYRANTVWKVGLQAFVMFDIVVGYIAVRVLSVKRSLAKKTILSIVITAVLASVMLFAWYGLRQPYGNLKMSEYKNLNVNHGIETRLTDDYNVIQWMRKNISDQPAIIEANGDSYSDYGRISIGTGFPTVMGWFVHEWYWRGEKNSNTEYRNERVNDVNTVYTSEDISATEAILKKYKIQYIIIGKLERDKFTEIKEDKLMGLGTVRYSSGETKLIKVNEDVLR